MSVKELNQWLDTIRYLQERIEELMPRWVRVEDETPPEDTCIKVAVNMPVNMRSRTLVYWAYKPHNAVWHWHNGERITGTVIAWLKMPDAPQYEDVKP
jgi:hypothetical protein